MQIDILKKTNGNKYLTLISTDESINTLKNMKQHGEKLKILIDQQKITRSIMIKNIWKSNSIQMMMVYLWKIIRIAQHNNSC